MMTALDLNPSEGMVLSSFPGIWCVKDGDRIVATSDNYFQKARGNWRTLAEQKLVNWLGVQWMVRPIRRKCLRFTPKYMLKCSGPR